MTNVMPPMFVRMSGREPGRRSIMSCPRAIAWISPVSATTPLLRVFLCGGLTRLRPSADPLTDEHPAALAQTVGDLGVTLQCAGRSIVRVE
jgi:hypothetical protein